MKIVFKKQNMTFISTIKGQGYRLDMDRDCIWAEMKHDGHGNMNMTNTKISQKRTRKNIRHG